MEAILAATAQLLEKLGYARTTTNAIAERAGVSIGSLYEYFPNKDSVVVALMEQQLDEQFAVFSGALEEMTEVPLAQATRALIEILIASKRVRPKLMQALATAGPTEVRAAFMRRFNQRSCQVVLAALRDRPEMARDQDLELSTFMAVNAVYGIIDAVLVERPSLLQSDDLIDELSALILGYLRTTP
ncbi:MAG TPA: TetR/AcrR family transcriptional regulator [Kofleriaceae bacterium]|nr:TetR/AcrR family transcriptional regulator [Kofleriaceae bacterium]